MSRVPGHAASMTGSGVSPEGVVMNGWLMWGLILPVLLVIAGVITLRRRNRR